MVVNLCSERGYEASKFDGRVMAFPFDDHNPPPMPLMHDFCRRAQEFLDADPENVLFVHCKAGKGRTGVMICAYLLHDGTWERTAEALDFYGRARTKNGKGVTIPSQRRYIGYYRHDLRQGVPPSRTVFVTRLVLSGPPTASRSSLVLTVSLSKIKVYKSEVLKVRGREREEVAFDISDLPVTGDVLVVVRDKKADEKVLKFWFNTAYLEEGATGQLRLAKDELDDSVKDKKHDKLPADFGVVLHFLDPLAAAEKAKKNYPPRPLVKVTAGEAEKGPEEVAGAPVALTAEAEVAVMEKAEADAPAEEAAAIEESQVAAPEVAAPAEAEAAAIEVAEAVEAETAAIEEAKATAPAEDAMESASVEAEAAAPAEAEDEAMEAPAPEEDKAAVAAEADVERS